MSNQASSIGSKRWRSLWTLFALAIFVGSAAAQSTSDIPSPRLSDLDYLVHKVPRPEAASAAMPFDDSPVVFRTKYKGKVAYYVPPRCCDIPSELYDENGRLICYPHGGFVGGDGRCPSFVPGAVPLTRVNSDVLRERPTDARR
jgi:hypothetical protein